MSAEEDKVVCVTGASGYIASWVVQRLLQRGYVVRATVRDTSNPKKTQHLVALDGAKERLQLVQADLLKEGDFDSAVDGCVGVFHTASPVFWESSNPQAELIDPALKGTLNVLKSCTKVSSIKRVILTSSTAAVLLNGKPLTPDVLIDESWYSNPEICKEMNNWYALSKTLAEEAAWNFAKDHGLDLVVINPTFVIGPLLQPTLNGSVQMILELINGGSETYPNSYYSFVDVRDVADAHLQAFEIPSASGRYLLTTDCHHYSEILKIAHQYYPTLILPQQCDLSNIIWPYHRTSTEKAKTLHLDFISLEESLRDTLESLKEKGFLNI